LNPEPRTEPGTEPGTRHLGTRNPSCWRSNCIRVRRTHAIGPVRRFLRRSC